jgi:hypothetical protein
MYKRAGGKMRKAVFVIVLGLLFASCGKDEVVKQVPRETQLSKEAFALAETIKNAFIDNDVELLRANSSEKGFDDITARKRAFDSVELSFTPRWVEIENNQIYLNIAWKSRWIISDKISEERGMAVFIMEGSPLKVSGILRANPFVYPGQ